MSTSTTCQEQADIVDHRTGLWTGVGVFSVGLVGIGMIFRTPAVVLAAILSAVYVGYAQMADPPGAYDPETGDPVVAIDREIDDPSPDPGDEVDITVEVRNTGPDFLSDVRIVDGVPPELEVIRGSPRHGTILRPGEHSVFSYTVAAHRGKFRWQQSQVAIADSSGSVERTTRIAAPTVLECELLPLEDPRRHIPLRTLTGKYPGRIETDTGGDGIEFYATREYRRGDPLSRIDWHRLARTGEFATIEFREERVAQVMLVLDTRRAAFLAPSPAGPHAVERSVQAAHQLFVALLETGDRVGITGFGPTEDDCWLDPYSGDEHRAWGRNLLSTHPAFSPLPPSSELNERYHDERDEKFVRQRIDRLHQRLSSDTQVILLSPCCDDYAPTIARWLDAYGHLVTLLSPDPTTDETPSQTLARIERADRLAVIRQRDVPVIDWAWEERLIEALARAQARWMA